MARVQVVVDEDERERFRAQARREGMSLSEWLRTAGRERLARAQPRALESRADLEAFFADVDARHAGAEPEEDWPVHKRRIAAARRGRVPADPP